MSVPHPFRVTRNAGTPSAGGSAHTLSQHIASSTAHPTYVKKGDEVGGSNSLTGHMNDATAHRQYYLTRSEVVDSVNAYNTAKGYSLNILSDTTSIRTVDYKALITAPILNALLTVNQTTALTVIPFMLTYSRIVTGIENDVLTHATQNNKDVPSWDLYKATRDLVNSFLKTSWDTPKQQVVEGNPLSAIFSLLGHTHADEYAAKEHTHGFGEVRNAEGDIPAASQHDHDGRYMLKGEGGSGSADLSKLASVGIYPYSYYNGTTNLDINTADVHGYYSFKFGKDTPTVGIPTSVTEGLNSLATLDTDDAYIKSSFASVQATATLHVMRAEEDLFDFSLDDVTNFLSAQPMTSVTGNFVTQLLFTNAPVPSSVRAADPERVITYKNKIYGNFVRNGYSLETAWYITSVIKQLLNETPANFYRNALSASDPLTWISNKVNYWLNYQYSDDGNTTKQLADGFVIGRYPVQASSEQRRIPLAEANLKWITDDDHTFKIASGVSVASEVAVIHDYSAWVRINGITTGNSTVQKLIGTDDVARMCTLTTHDHFLDYLNYYTYRTNYTEISDYNTERNTTGLYYQTGTNSFTPISTYYTTSYPTMTNDVGDEYVVGYLTTDDFSAPLGCYQTLLKKIDNTYPSGTYAIIDSYDVNYGGVARYHTEAKDPATYSGNLYTIVTYVKTDGGVSNKIFAKRPVHKDEVLSLTAKYYLFNTVQNRFIEQPYSTLVKAGDNKADYENLGEPVYTNYLIYEGSVQARKVTPVYAAGTRFQPSEVVAIEGVDYQCFDSSGNPLQTEVVYPTKVDSDSDYDSSYWYAKFSSVEETNGTLATPTVLSISNQAGLATALGNLEDNEYIGFVIPEAGKVKLLNKVVATCGPNSTAFTTVAILTPTFKDNDVTLLLSDTTKEFYLKSFFYLSKDADPISGKVYYSRGAELDVDKFTPVVVTTGDHPTAKGWYERIGMEDFFNIWLAINELVTAGASSTVTGVGDRVIKYNFTASGDLITWDPWSQMGSGGGSGGTSDTSTVREFELDLSNATPGQWLEVDTGLISAEFHMYTYSVLLRSNETYIPKPMAEVAKKDGVERIPVYVEADALVKVDTVNNKVMFLVPYSWLTLDSDVSTKTVYVRMAHLSIEEI